MIIAAMRFLYSFKTNTLEPDVYHLNAAKSDTDAFKKLIKYAHSYARVLFVVVVVVLDLSPRSPTILEGAALH